MLRYRQFFKDRALRSQKLVQKIDLSEVYPCPTCRHRGTIKEITLTEAFGCDRCQQIYVIRDGGFGLEQLSGAHPYRRLWRWTGHQWKQYSQLPASSWLGLLVIIAILLAISGFWLLLSTSFRILAVLLAGLAGGAILTSRR
ncbi:hypothetical protein D0962_11830 [Leptolyngbyaceae cyanobacterium CCMR0082]|uniref:Uncharacterized protein n=2 Tax=Adonisia turfae TaxID=2950184 RepID=A0A6M0S4Z9_9CYAN|nr:hypothetical protein [Leptothoe sp. LEGE 181152]NEZ55330.1 hypothetical protein [Adonisia turfae CCMR0081]NEZ63465.1 hypothetical protein [Adonisia turfae CCMR0082]